MSNARMLSAAQTLMLFCRALSHATEKAVIILGRNYWAITNAEGFQKFVDLILYKMQRGVEIDVIIDWRQYALGGQTPVAQLIALHDPNISVWSYATGDDPNANWANGICTENGNGFMIEKHEHDADEMVIRNLSMGYEEFADFALGHHDDSPYRSDKSQIYGLYSPMDGITLLGGPIDPEGLARAEVEQLGHDAHLDTKPSEPNGC